MRTIRTKFATIALHDWGARVTFDDGAHVDACPDWEGRDYAVIAHRLGYQYDVLAYCHEHEIAHLFVSEKLTDKPSLVLWKLAHNERITAKEGAYEEAFAQILQRLVRANERPILSGIPFDDWKRDFLALMDGAA